MRASLHTTADRSGIDNLIGFWERANFTRIPSYAGLVGSGTLTPECFTGCLRSRFPYIRVQPVLRLLDARGAGSRLHKALFTQLQIFAPCNVEAATELLISFISTILGDVKIDVTPDFTPWHALSIGARGLGKEVFVHGIEVAQINKITTMGVRPLREPGCLLAIGIERLILAGLELNAVTSPYPVTAEFSIESLLSNFDAGLAVARALEGRFHELGGPALNAERNIAMLGDIQTDVDFAFTTGTITHSYRQHLLRKLREEYRTVAAKLPRDAAPLLEGYTPRWTIEAVCQLSASTSPEPSQHAMVETTNQDKACANVETWERVALNKEALKQRDLPDRMATDRSEFSYSEFRQVQQREWEQSPEVQCAFAERMWSETGGPDLLRVNRLRENATRMLELLGLSNQYSANVLSRCVRLSQLEERSFVAKAIPTEGNGNLQGYLHRWNMGELDLKMLEARARIRKGVASLNDVPLEALCFAFYEEIDVLFRKVGFSKLRYNSSADPGRIKHHSKRAIALGGLIGVSEERARIAYDQIGRSLGLPEKVISAIFTGSYDRFQRPA